MKDGIFLVLVHFCLIKAFLKYQMILLKQHILFRFFGTISSKELSFCTVPNVFGTIILNYISIKLTFKQRSVTILNKKFIFSMIEKLRNQKLLFWKFHYS